MKKSYQLLFLIITSFIFSSYGQEQKVIEDEYAAYFTLPRENLYLHLNKTSYFVGEEIWFKGYAYDQKNQLLSKATTNINVGLYDAKGKQVKKALFEAINGVTQGHFAVDSTFTAGTYYIKGGTNWMKNFKEDNAFVQKIEIISNKETAKNKGIKEARFDFQFLPEGGHIVANTTSNIGFKVVDNTGKGIPSSGIVYDENKKQVASFESNTLGMGKFLLQPKKSTKYTAEITLENGTIITKELPTAKAQGLSLVLQSLSENQIILEFSTNKETLEKNPAKEYKILIHQNGKLKTAALKFNGTKKAVSLQKNQLYKGVNTITVFDNNQNPILERLFFNDYGIKQTTINVSKLNTIEDSILLSIKELKLDNTANVSISVLPETTQSYNPQNNILSNFYLKPHVQGFVENAAYYFHKMDKKKKSELDILLLTQGWSRYDWKDIFSSKPNALHRFENGITISGSVNRPISGVKRIFLHTTKNHPARFIDLDKDQKFELSGLFLEEDEEVRFSYINKKGIFKKPNMYLRFKVADGTNKISNAILTEATSISSSAINFKIPEDFFYEDSQELDKVVIKVKREKEERDPFLINAKVTRVTKELYNRYFNITDFIRDNGYDVYENMGEIFITARRRFITDLETQKSTQPLVYYDGARLGDLSVLYGMSTANVEKIVIDKTGLGQGSIGGFGGVIKIFSRRTPLFTGSSSNKVYSGTKTTKAFTPTKEYYAPKYASYLSSTFERYGAISWIPEIKLNKSQPVNFKIYDTRTKNITLFIEGISENGDLISERKTIQVR